MDCSHKKLTLAPLECKLSYRKLHDNVFSSSRGFHLYRDSDSNPESAEVTQGQSNTNKAAPSKLSVLGSRPINISAQYRRKVLVNLKSSRLGSKSSYWKLSNDQIVGDCCKRGNYEDCADAATKREGQRRDNGDDARTNAARVHQPSNGDWRGHTAKNHSGLTENERLDFDVQLQHQQSTKVTSDVAKHNANEAADVEVEMNRVLADRKKLVLAQLEVKFATSPQSERQLSDDIVFPSGILSASDVKRPETPSTIEPTISSAVSSHSNGCSNNDGSAATSPPVFKTVSVESRDKTIPSQLDNAKCVNIGEDRYVAVEYSPFMVDLPITADTYPIDILRATADKTEHHINPATNIVLERDFKFGLERRLRRYEAICDVVDSWENDLEHSLHIVPCSSSYTDQDFSFEPTSHTKEPPTGFSMEIYYSSKPGKCNKCWITLLQNGDIYANSVSNTQLPNMDRTLICSLADFDIYVSDASIQRRNVQPPAKYCYVLKNQQKKATSTKCDNLFHFFSTEDAEQAASFYEKIHFWRSWYIFAHVATKEVKTKRSAIRAIPSDYCYKPLRNIFTATPKVPKHSQERKKEPSGSGSTILSTPNLLNVALPRVSLSASQPEKPAKIEEQKRPGPESNIWFPSAVEHSTRETSKVTLQAAQRRRKPTIAATTTKRSISHRREHSLSLLSFLKGLSEPPKFYEGLTGIRTLPGQPLINYAIGIAEKQPYDGASRGSIPRSKTSASNVGFSPIS
ncbi:hypothetical protein QQS21_004096 [Conoideocrella luteorostrata]|uniref:PH domain-containing protein n=1 Tax=Conoideocrella luteorostrata TaxID=1105319 RepID=A0AAJ0CT17_9HYPO|nr:hypothetical protein QQS21_004096 [Conoideocrella luteorostrata]